MIVCDDCGQENPSGVQFCGRCGAYLEWKGAPAHEVSPPVTVAATPAVTPPVTPAVTPAVAPAVTPAVAPAVTPAEAPVVTESKPAATTAEPAAVQPGERQVRRQTEAPVDDRPPADGELVCGECGAGNDPQRRFCRRCGHVLAAAEEVQQRPSWWRRLWRRLTGRRVYQAGDRRRLSQPSRLPGRLLALLVVVLLVVAALGPGRPAIRWAVTEVKDRVSTAAPVTPIAVRASVSAPEHGPELLIDGAKNRFWAAPEDKAVGAWVEVELPQPVRLLDLIVTSGVSGDKKEFLQEGRPQELEVAVTDRAGKVTTTVVRLLDQPEGQRFAVKVSDAVRVRLTVRSTYGGPDRALVALAEVELFART